MLKEVASLKIDFKIESNGLVRIIDLGDGFSASTDGFNDVDVVTKMLVYMHEATKAPIVPIFGELLHVSNGLQAAKIPIVLRKKNSFSWLKSDDLNDLTRYIPFSELRRIHPYVAYFWGKENKKAVVPPIGLVAMEMHKALWYFLMEKEMRADEKPKLVFWNNDADPLQLDLNILKSQSEYGYFIKIVDRSASHGEDVYYVKNEQMLKNKLSEIYRAYKSDIGGNSKHLYVIEPAYITTRQYRSQSYNVTGRAFITLIFDTQTQQLQVKIAAAKWLCPRQSLNSSMLQEQMLANNANSICYLDLNDQELSALTTGISKSYAQVFGSCFVHENLLEYCRTHSYMMQFKSCLRINTVYLGLLNLYQDGVDAAEQIIQSMVDGLIAKHYLFQIQNLLNFEQSYRHFSSVPYKDEDTFMRLCRLSCYKHYIEGLDTLPQDYKRIFAFIPQLILYKKRVDELILSTTAKFLRENDRSGKEYEKLDLNKALRQAAYWGNPSVMTALIYTGQADPIARSPSNQTAADWAEKNNNSSTKTQCLRILEDTRRAVIKSESYTLNYEKKFL